MEIWKDVAGYEGFYQISDKGQIKKCKKWDVNKRDYINIDQVLKPFDNGHGYLVISLAFRGKRKNKYIHRLVADAFIKNPYNKGYVNHLDYNRSNNSADNLEWCTQKENTRYSAKNMRVPRKLLTNTGEFYISRRKNGKYRVTVKHKEYGPFGSLADAIAKRNEVLDNVGINFK